MILNDDCFDECTITKVDGNLETGWSVTKSDGYSCWVPKDSPVRPMVGMTIRCYTINGTFIRGMVLDGKTVFYRTEAEQRLRWADERKEENQKNQEKAVAERNDRDVRWSRLPCQFSKRRDRFMEGNSNFARDYEPYELFCCEQSVVIHDACNGDADVIREFAKLEWREQKERIPLLSDEHSGNTFGVSVRLAIWLATAPENVVREHGAMAMLVGCDEYGCTHEDSQ